MKKPSSFDSINENTRRNSFSIYGFHMRVIVACVLFIGLIYGVELHVGWSLVLSDWNQLNLTAIISITMLIFLSHLLRIVRIHFTYNLTHKVRFIDVSAVSLLHNTLSFLLPMRIGEAALPLLSRKQLNINIGYATATLFVVRLCDLHVLLMLLLFFTSSLFLEKNLQWVSVICLLALPFGVAIVRYLSTQLKFLAPVQLLLTSYFVWLKIYIFTLAIWGVKLSALAFLAQQFGILALDHAWIATIMADGSALSPITGIANTGTFEAAFSLPLLSFGYHINELLRIAVNVHIFIFVTNLISGIIGFALLRHTKTINA